MLIRRDALVASGGCDERVFVQDYALALRLAARCCFGVTDTVVMAAPQASGPGRLSHNKAQILHDLNLALLLFLQDQPELPARYRHRALRRIAARSWKWARREAGRGILSRECLWCLGAALGMREAAWNSLETFTEAGQVRQLSGFRHPRASGGPGATDSATNLDSRLRGNDGT
jgi:hypothetical protein